MKKVYGCSNYFIFVTLILCSFTLYLAFLVNGTAEVMLRLIGPFAFLSLVLLIRLIRTFLFPVWAYDGEGFAKVGFTGKMREKIPWGEVNSVDLNSSRGPRAYSIWYRKYHMLGVGGMYTRDGLAILGEIVPILQKKNPSATVGPYVLEKLGYGMAPYRAPEKGFDLALVALFALAFLGVAVVGKPEFVSYFAAQKGLGAHGKIVAKRVGVERGSGPSKDFYLRVQYQDVSGISHESEARVGQVSFDHQKIGEKVALHYLPQFPDGVSLDQCPPSWVTPVAIAVFLVVFLAVIISLLVRFIVRSAQTREPA